MSVFGQSFVFGFGLAFNLSGASVLRQSQLQNLEEPYFSSDFAAICGDFASAAQKQIPQLAELPDSSLEGSRVEQLHFRI